MKKNILFVLVVIVTAAFALLANSETITLPESLTRIEDEAFAGLQAEFVVFPDTLEYIAEDALISCITETPPRTLSTASILPVTQQKQNGSACMTQ